MVSKLFVYMIRRVTFGTFGRWGCREGIMIEGCCCDCGVEDGKIWEME